jgi:dTDP-4-dehydrorhamnose 3,5-epimerase-like enzyme
MKPCRIELPTFTDERGILTAMEKRPFEVKRAFWIYGASQTRGQHSHRVGEQLIVAVHGSFTVMVRMGDRTFYWRLKRPDTAIYLPPSAWVQLYNWSDEAVALVLCSEYYDSEDIERGTEMEGSCGS